MPEIISPSDLALIQKAQASINQAQLLYNFAVGHLSEMYALTQEDHVDLNTGVITRAEVPVAPEVTD